MKQIIKKQKVWVSIGSHGGIFQFEYGKVADRYPTLMWVFAEKVSDDLIPATITYKHKEG